VLFFLKEGSRTHRGTNYLVEGDVSHTNARKKVLACVLLKNKFQNGVLVCSVTKIPLTITVVCPIPQFNWSQYIERLL
jgi:hypothetical protein